MERLYVIKLGSSTVMHHPEVFKEIAELAKSKVRILLVAGGAEAIKAKYESLNRDMPFLQLITGDTVRYCAPAEMPIIREAYHEYILKEVRKNLDEQGLSGFLQCGGENNIVCGKKGGPLKCIKNNKTMIIRDSLFGKYAKCNVDFLQRMLDVFDVVCVTPPIIDGSTYINIDADMLAAHLAVELEAEHLRFVTNTSGILKNIEDPSSIVKDVYQNMKMDFVQGRMKQKVRAADLAVKAGVGDVCISGPSTLEGKTWFWNFEKDDSEFEILNKSVSIPSISHDERVLAEYLQKNVSYPEVTCKVDEVGNIVFQKGNGTKKRLMLLGHIDTVPYVWKPNYDEDSLSARGVVDAKGSFCNFIEMLKQVEVPEDCRLLVVGAVEEEVSSSKGAFYVRDHYEADAVIIGEPSGYENVTLGYYGLCKLKIMITKELEHTAAKDGISGFDKLYEVVRELRDRISSMDEKSISSLISISSFEEKGKQVVYGILNCRISPDVEKDYISNLNLNFDNEVEIEVLRATPGYQSKRNTSLAKAFARSFKMNGMPINYLVKRGTSDMNTLATTWDVPMIAYGPGDSSLDHTMHEKLFYKEVRDSRKVLKNAIEEWFNL